jgi:hypothetical protein
MIKEKQYIYWGIFFILIQILAIIRNIYSGYFSFFWYCDFTPGIFALLFFLKNNQAIKGLLNIGLFAQLGYAFILIFHLITGGTLFGFVFDFSGSFYIGVTLLLHLSTLVVLFATYKTKPEKNSLLYSFIFLILIYATVLIFTSPSRAIAGNYDFIYYSKLLSPYLQYYTELWILLAFTIVVLPTYFFQQFLYRLYWKKHKK